MMPTRKISLTQIHAINWYGYADSIPVQGNLLLAGVTGSGKSILMDLLQFVLLGDLRMVKFNQSATGATSSRDLKSYVLGDIKEDEDGVAQYMRDSAIAYVALEFTWPLDDPERSGHVETWGLRVEYTTAADIRGDIKSWWCEGKLERGDFLTVLPNGQRGPRALPDWRAFIEAREGEIFANINEYRRDMASLGHLNFDHNILSRLLPTAMSFTFLKSFNEFCRNHILPPDKLNVTDVTASYRIFQRYEEELAGLHRQLKALRAIRGLHEEETGFSRDAALSRYLAAELDWQHLEQERVKASNRFDELKAAADVEGKRLGELDELIPRQRARIDQIKSTINNTPDGRLYLFIRSQNKDLVAQIERLKEIGTTLESALAARARAAHAWMREVSRLKLDQLPGSSLDAVKQTITQLEEGGVSRADETLRALAAAGNKAASEISRAARSFTDRLLMVRRELGRLREEVAHLKLRILPGGSPLLDALNDQLPAGGDGLPAQHLCKLCEVTDEHWRPAIEIAFGRKFAVVVSREDYDRAEAIYHAMKFEQFRPGAHPESLVNPVTALRQAAAVQAGSLAEKIETFHPVAAAIVSHLFGNLMCCERYEELRQHDRAILPDGFMIRGAFVERVRHYQNEPYVGERGFKQQQRWKETQIAELELEETRLKPIDDMISAVQQSAREQFVDAPSLYKELTSVSRLPDLERQRDENIQNLKQIDRTQFDEWDQQRAALERDLETWEIEWRKLLTNQKYKDAQRAAQALKEAESAAADAKSKHAKIAGEYDVSVWLSRLEELRAEACTEFPPLELAARHLHDCHREYDHKAEIKRLELTNARKDFARDFPKFDDLSVVSEDNDAYNRILAKIDKAEIPEYEQKSKDERRRWEQLFREQVLEKLRLALNEVKNSISLLNTSLNKPIGTSRYRISHRANPEFAMYHRMLEATTTAGSDLFASISDEVLREEISHFLKLLVEAADGVEAARLLDYRHYFDYDMLVEDISLPPEERRWISVDRQSGKFSGGENQSPYFIAILASYLRAYRRQDRYRNSPTLTLVPIDEAFSKLSGERIADCIDALKQLDLQGVFSMSTGNIPGAFEKCEHLLVISKDERRVGHKLKVRNIAVSIARDSEQGREFIRNYE